MTNFEEACKMSAEKWVASLPDEVEAHKFSQKHIDAINEIIYPKIYPSHWRVTRLFSIKIHKI